MWGLVCGVVMALLGALLAVGGGYVGFVVLPPIVDQQVEENVVLHNDTIQMERFLVTPLPLHFKVYIFNVSNAEAMNAAGGAILQVKELGPWVYKQFAHKEVLDMDDDTITYREHLRYEFDAEESYPRTEEDEVTVVNVPYHAILQGAEAEQPGLMLLLSTMLNQIFGAANNRAVFTTSVRALLFDGIPMCVNPNFLGRIPCDQIRASIQDSDNMLIFEDGSFSFSFFNHKGSLPSGNFTIDRGLVDSYNLGEILQYEGSQYLSTWGHHDEDDEVNVCNMINGTDAAIYRPFLSRDEPLRAFNPDICRSVLLEYERDTEYEGIPAVRFRAPQTLLAGDDDCFCLNETAGVTRDDGCLYPGAMELYTCTGAHMVFTSPHFLYAHDRYRNGVVGVNPRPEDHQIFIELEPSSGTILRGAKRAQFNMFMRPITNIGATNSLRPTLAPILWVEEGISLTEEFVEEVKDTLLRPVRLIAILRAAAIALGAAIALLGLWLAVRHCCARRPPGGAKPPAAADAPDSQSAAPAAT